jgi:UDPglucose 6-dehydrogenase
MYLMESNSTPIVTILGTGYVGLTTAALFAASGIKTYVVDPNGSRLESVRRGRSFFYEEGLDPLVAHGVKSKMLIPTSSYAESVPKSDIVFSAVGTPDNPDGSSNLTYLFAAGEEAAGYLKPSAVFVQKSTVPVGTGAKIRQLFDKQGCKAAYVSNPEFLRESTALRDSLWFDRIVVGGSDAEALERVIDIYRTVQKSREEIAGIAGLDEPNILPPEQYMSTSLESAELIKVTSNAFLALKISFANSIAKLADHTGANITEVMDAVGADARIARSFLNAGRGYGGGCFPKDVSGLISSASEHGVDLSIMTAASEVNESMPGYIVNKAQSVLGKLDGKHVAVLGLAFKAGTSDARRSPGVKLANIMSRDGAIVAAYDPEANKEAEGELRKGIVVCDSIEKAIKNADAVFIATDWKQFLALDLHEVALHLEGKKLFVDCMNAFSPLHVEDSGLMYLGVGR